MTLLICFIVWFIGMFAVTLIPPRWVQASKRQYLREMLSSAYFGITLTLFIPTYAIQTILTGEISYGKRRYRHFYHLATEPELFWTILVIAIVVLLPGIPLCWSIFKRNQTLYRGA